MHAFLSQFPVATVHSPSLIWIICIIMKLNCLYEQLIACFAFVATLLEIDGHNKNQSIWLSRNSYVEPSGSIGRDRH